MKKFIYLIVLSVFVLLSITQCSNKENEKNFVVKAKFLSPKTQIIFINLNKKEQIKLENEAIFTFKQNDVLKVKKGNALFIIKNIGKIKIYKDSVLIQNTITENKSLLLEKGRMLMSFQKLRKKDKNIEIATPTAVVGVRGTTFDISLKRNNTTIVSLYEGKVAVAKVLSFENSNKQAREIVLNSGQKAIVREKGEIEIERLKIDEIKYIDYEIKRLKLLDVKADISNINISSDVDIEGLKIDNKDVNIIKQADESIDENKLLSNTTIKVNRKKIKKLPTKDIKKVSNSKNTKYLSDEEGGF